MRPAIFLDRDGVIIENRDTYVRRWEDVAFLPGSLDALARIRESPYPIIILTNQSAVGRGIITLSQAQEINQKLQQAIEHNGGRVNATYMCPHAPEEACSCRKPEPGLFFQASADLAIDLGRSIMIGDAFSDLIAGQKAGLVETALVLTGRGRNELTLHCSAVLEPFLIFDSLLHALNHFSQYRLFPSPQSFQGPEIGLTERPFG